MNKFRIYDKDLREYVEELDHRWLMSRSGRIYNTEIDEWFNPGERYIVEWSTGSLDATSKDIFEGDICELRYKSNNLPTVTGIVVWAQLHCHFSLVSEKGGSYSLGMGGSMVDGIYIVGNIHN